jgi:hypothetical protein
MEDMPLILGHPLQKEDSAALTKLAHSMLETPYHRMVDTIKKETSLAKKQADADA